MRGSAALRTGITPGGALAGPWVRNPLWTAARAVPSLDLRFADNKSLTDATTGQNLVTFTRASSGTYVDSQGVIRTATTNEARFDHNPTTGESLGLLVEEQRTNLQTNSENIPSLGTLLGSTVASNIITAPDGQVTADKLTEDTSTGAHQASGISISWAGNTTYTVSVYAKPDTRSVLTVAFGTSSNWVNSSRTASFNLSNGTVSSQSGTPLVASIQALPNGWYRCVASATTVAAPVASTLVLQLNNGSTTSYTGDGASGLFLWGVQLEAGSFPTSYIPTTTATATRSADVASITGSNFGVSRTNLSARSEELDDAVAWAVGNAAIPTANVAVAPNGASTADKLIASNGLSGAVLFQTTTLLASTTYTYSIYAKAAEWGWVALQLRGPENVSSGAWFDLTSGSVGTIDAGVSATIQAAGNGWYRCVITKTTGTGAGTGRQRIYTTNANGVFSTGDGTSGILLWGSQLETGSAATAYIPTTTAAVTVVDSPWYRQDEGTLYGDSIFAAINNTRIAALSDNTAAKRIILSRGSGSNGNINMSVTDTTAQVSGLVFATALAAGTSNKVAAVYKASDFAGSANGLAAVAQTTGTVPLTLTQLGIGTGETIGGNTMTGTIKRLVYWPQRLPNNVLQSITQ